MKKILAGLLSVTILLINLSIAFAEEDDYQYNPTNEYGTVDEYGNYVPIDTYFCGELVGTDENIDIARIDAVTLTIGDLSYEVPVDDDGKFSLMLPDGEGYAVITIPDEKLVVSENPNDNNKIFMSLTDSSYKTIYVGTRSNITATVMNGEETETIAGAVVTCYYRANKDSEWSLWLSDENTDSANKITDEKGQFCYAATSGQYRFVIKAKGYASYDSAEREYVSGISPTGETTEVTLHLTPDKQMSLVSVTPEQGEALPPDGSIKIVFSQPVSTSVVSSYNNIRLDRVSTKSYVPFVATVNGNEVTIKPEDNLFEGQKYNLIITSNITATDGAKLDIDRVITFTCEKSVQVLPPETDEAKPDDTAVGQTNDISGHWSESYMQKLIDLSIIVGIDKEGILYYYPDKPLTRAEFAKYIVISQGMDTANAATGTFVDGDSIPYELRPYVYGAYNAGIIQGSQEEDGLYFMPNSTITRAEIITILGRIIGDTSDAPLDFGDSEQVPDWARPYVAGCVAKGYVNGDNDTGVMLLRPNDDITRCEAATIISKVINN